MRKYSILLSLLIVQCLTSISQNANPYNTEIIYHVCQRSFFDSNGDLHGDLRGLKEKLPYLQELGVTSILLFPLHDADCYHNYFANDFEKIDPEFGTIEDYLSLVKEIHRRGMKVYMDMETQYVADKHIWWKEAVGNPASKYSDYLLFEDSAHTIPATIIADLRGLNSYDGNFIKITTVNLREKKVLDYNKKLFGFFTDPNGDGKFDDGVDGFRLDHAMDNLDGKPALRNLFRDFWKPLLDYVKQINPRLQNVAEQADWNDYGFTYFEQAGVDRMFGFGLRSAILSFDKKELIRAADTILVKCPEGRSQLIFLENHDLDRFASLEPDIRKQKSATVLMMLIGGIPSIYYGQEIGMLGKSVARGNTDGNDIPRREAFEWYKKNEGPGMAFWYKNTGEWWDKSNVKANDGISFEEQKAESSSLFIFYKQLIRLKKSNPALAGGKYANAVNDNDKVFSFYRTVGKRKVLVVVNLSGDSQKAIFQDKMKKSSPLFGKGIIQNHTIQLNPYEVIVMELK
ncbi:MAG: alpha-amylase [Chitinophagaceae bacterium]|nr:alpha-amylase [Chitinophagaceae bacterium]